VGSGGDFGDRAISGTVYLIPSVISEVWKLAEGGIK
jgi:hypothetical protein